MQGRFEAIMHSKSLFGEKRWPVACLVLHCLFWGKHCCSSHCSSGCKSWCFSSCSSGVRIVPSFWCLLEWWQCLLDAHISRGGKSCQRVMFVSCQCINIIPYGSTKTQSVKLKVSESQTLIRPINIISWHDTTCFDSLLINQEMYWHNYFNSYYVNGLNWTK